MDNLHNKDRWQPIEDCNPAVVPACRVHGDDAVSGRPAGVDSIGNFFFLKDFQFHIGLEQPPQRRLQTPVSAVTNVIGAEPNRHFPPL